MSAKEPCMSAKEPCISAKVPCISAKEPCIYIVLSHAHIVLVLSFVMVLTEDNVTCGICDMTLSHSRATSLSLLSSHVLITDYNLSSF